MERVSDIVAILKSFEVDRLLKLMALHARKHHDGHFTVFSFTTGYKAAFGTPDLDIAGAGRVQLQKIEPQKKLKDSLVQALSDEKDFYSHFTGDLGDVLKELYDYSDEKIQ
jgi:hypothetical protein